MFTRARTDHPERESATWVFGDPTREPREASLPCRGVCSLRVHLWGWLPGPGAEMGAAVRADGGAPGQVLRSRGCQEGTFPPEMFPFTCVDFAHRSHRVHAQAPVVLIHM